MKRRKVLRIIAEVLCEAWHEMLYVLGGALMPIATLFEVALPYVMWFVGVQCYIERQKFAVGGEVFIPMMVLLVIGFTKRVANKIGRGSDVPIPEKRFTEIDQDGEVSIEQDRLQELILYMGELEEWIERKGMTRGR